MKRYSTDLTDAQWALIEPLLPPERPRGRHRAVSLRRVLDAIFYLDKSACTWRDLPGDFPHWETVYAYFARWRDDGTLRRVYDALHRQWRLRVGRDPTPSAGAIDSQSVQAAEEAESRGSDRNKRVVGRKRHLIVDTEGLPVAVVVTSAAVNDKAGARLLLAAVREALPRLKKLWADAGYRSGPLAAEARAQGIELEVVERHAGGGFVVMARRWVVERTFAWLSRYRRLSKDYEYLPETSEAMIYAAMSRLMLRRLTRPKAVRAAA